MSRASAFAWHLLVSTLVCSSLIFLALQAFFPHQIKDVMETHRVVWPIILTTVACGSLLNIALYRTNKSKRELAIDFTLIISLQLGFLGYGIQILWKMHPIFLVYAADRFHLVSHSDIQLKEQSHIPVEISKPKIFSEPEMAGVLIAKPEDSDYLEQLDRSLSGEPAYLRTSRWRPYKHFKEEVLKHAKPINKLIINNQIDSTIIDDALKSLQTTPANTAWIPVEQGINDSWILILDNKSAKPLKYIKLPND